MSRRNTAPSSGGATSWRQRAQELNALLQVRAQLRRRLATTSGVLSVSANGESFGEALISFTDYNRRVYVVNLNGQLVHLSTASARTGIESTRASPRMDSPSDVLMNPIECSAVGGMAGLVSADGLDPDVMRSLLSSNSDDEPSDDPFESEAEDAPER